MNIPLLGIRTLLLALDNCKPKYFLFWIIQFLGFISFILAIINIEPKIFYDYDYIIINIENKNTRLILEIILFVISFLDYIFAFYTGIRHYKQIHIKNNI